MGTVEIRNLRCRALVVVGFATALLSACSRPAPLVTEPEHPSAAVAIIDASVLDVTSGIITPAQDVLVTGTRITSIGASGTLTIPAGAQRIEAGGATLLPGLIDSHAHVANSSNPPWTGSLPDPERNLQAYLYCGVTTVFDPADLEPDAFERRDDVSAGKLLAPTLYVAGPMLTAAGGHPLPVIEALAPWWIGWYVKRHAVRPLRDNNDVTAAIDELAAAHADFVKIAIDSVPKEAPKLDEALTRTVVETAHAKKLRVVAHVGSIADAMTAGNAGVDAFMHMVYEEPLDAAAATKIAAFGKPMVPTMTVFESYALMGRGAREPTALERETVAAEALTAFDRIPGDAVPAEFRSFFDMLHNVRMQWRTSIRLLRERGVTILTGSDAQSGVFPGAGTHREFALLVESGMSPAEVVRAATWDAARFLENSEDPSFGRVAAGKRADLLLVDGNPVQDVANLARIKAVIKRGVVLERHPVSH